MIDRNRILIGMVISNGCFSYFPYADSNEQLFFSGCVITPERNLEGCNFDAKL